MPVHSSRPARAFSADTADLDILERLRSVELHLQVRSGVAPPEVSLMEPADLLRPESGPAARLLALFAPPVHGNRRAVAASLMLRFGWAAGYAIGSYMVCERVPRLNDYALEFSEQGLLRALWIRAATFQDRGGRALRATAR